MNSAGRYFFMSDIVPHERSFPAEGHYIFCRHKQQSESNHFVLIKMKVLVFCALLEDCVRYRTCTVASEHTNQCII